MDNCPDNNDIACYFDGLLLGYEVEQLEKHFVECKKCREIVVITIQIMSQEQNFLDNCQKSNIINMKIRCVPRLKGEVPDVKKVKPSLQASMPKRGFFVFRRGMN